MTVHAAEAENKVTTSDKILLQATMQQSIDRQLVNGKYFYFDAKAAEVQSLYPAKTHPMILQMGAHFVLCTNFRSAEGKEVNVDFYVARQDDGFVVFDTVVDDRVALKRLMSAGMVKVIK